MRSHHGPSSTTMAEISSATPASGLSSAMFSCARCSVATPPASRITATVSRMTNPVRRDFVVRPATGCTRFWTMACSSWPAFRQIRMSPAPAMATGQMKELSHPTLNTENRMRRMISSDP